MTDRGWIVRTVLDPEATRGEVEAALAAATPQELRTIREELDLTIAWAKDRQRDRRGLLAHLREQHPELRPQK